MNPVSAEYYSMPESKMEESPDVVSIDGSEPFEARTCSGVSIGHSMEGSWFLSFNYQDWHRRYKSHFKYAATLDEALDTAKRWLELISDARRRRASRVQ